MRSRAGALMLGLVGPGGSVGFLEIFFSDGVRLRGAAKFAQFGLYGGRFAGRCENADGGFAVAQLGADAFTVGLAEAKSLVVKRPQCPAAEESHAEADRGEQGQSHADTRTLAGTALAHLLSLDLALVVQDENSDCVVVGQPGVLHRFRGRVRGGLVFVDCQYNGLVCHDDPFGCGSGTTSRDMLPLDGATCDGPGRSSRNPDR